MKAVSVRQPWAWAIIHAGKDVENRSRITLHRGPVAIHATRCSREEYESAAEEIESISKRLVPSWDAIKETFGRIVGIVDLVGCIDPDRGDMKGADSEWYQGEVGWRLAKPRTCKPYACKGARGYLFDIPDGEL